MPPPTKKKSSGLKGLNERDCLEYIYIGIAFARLREDW